MSAARDRHAGLSMVQAGWKLFRVRRDGSLGSLFIDVRRRLPEMEWLAAKSVPTRGYAVRVGWHIAERPNLPHLSRKGRIMKQVLFASRVERHERPESQGGVWWTATRMMIL